MIRTLHGSALLLVVTGCRPGSPGGRLARDIGSAIDTAVLIGAICFGLIGLLFALAVLATLIKNLRSPSPGSVMSGKVLGILNVLVGSLLTLAVVLDPPSQPSIPAVPESGEWVDMAAGGQLMPGTPGTPAIPGGIDWGDTLLLLAFAAAWLGFGLALYWVALNASKKLKDGVRSLPPEPVSTH